MSHKLVETITLPREKVQVTKRVKVVVVGGGPSGLSAAVAAARNDHDVLLIERNSYLGGVATAGLCPSFMGADPLITRGFAREIINRMKELDCVIEGFTTNFDEEIMKHVADEIATQAGVKLLFNTWFSRAIVENGYVKGVVVLNKSGHQAILADVVIDATGDGDVAVNAGASFEMGDEQGQMQPVTLMFRMVNVNVKRFVEYVSSHREFFNPIGGRFDNEPSQLDISMEPFLVSIEGLGPPIKEAKEKGELYLSRDHLAIVALSVEGQVLVNATRVIGVDGTDVNDITKALLDARRQVMSTANFLRNTIPGFEKSYLIDTGHDLGVRETRRIIGDYTLTKEDIIEGKRFSDAITRNSMPLDIHGPGTSDTWIKPRARFYEIPYRCLLPKGLENILVAGRCISVTHDALASARSMICCMGTGQASGTAASAAAKEGITPRNIDIAELQELLTDDGLLWAI